MKLFVLFWSIYSIFFSFLVALTIYGYIVGVLVMRENAFLETSPYFYVIFLVQLILPLLSLFLIISTPILLFKKLIKGKLKIFGIAVLSAALFFLLSFLTLLFLALR